MRAGIPTASAVRVKGAERCKVFCSENEVPKPPRQTISSLLLTYIGVVMARDCAYRRAEIMIRTAGYTAPIRAAWRFTNQANSFQNLMATALPAFAARTATSIPWTRA